MDDLELKKLWKATNEKWDKSLSLSQHLKEDIAHIKVQNRLFSMRPIKLFAILIGVVWVSIGGVALISMYIYAFSTANIFFLLSASVQVGLTGMALIVYLYQFITIHQVDISEPIVKTQEKLASLNVSTLWVARILFLQLPVWTTFWWNQTMIAEWSIWQWAISLCFTLLFTIIAVWLFFNITYENRNKKWFQYIFNGPEWTPLMKSMALLEQVKEYKEV